MFLTTVESLQPATLMKQKKGSGEKMEVDDQTQSKEHKHVACPMI